MKKESVLEEDSILYTHNAGEEEGKKWRRLKTRQKLQYFNDYYRNKVLLGLLLFIFVGSYIYTVMTNKEPIVTLAVLNDSWGSEKIETLIKEAKKAMEAEGDKIIIDDTYYFESGDGVGDIAAIQKFSAHMIGGDIDIILSDRKKFEELMKEDLLLNLKEVADKLPYSEEKVIADGYGLKIDETMRLYEMGIRRDERILCIVSSAKEKKNYKEILTFLTFLLQKP